MPESDIKPNDERLHELYAQALKEQDAGRLLTLYQEIIFLSSRQKQTKRKARSTM